MNETFFSEKAQKYITNEMSLCINGLTNKILNDVPNRSQFFNDLFEYMMKLEAPWEYDLNNPSNPNNKKINKYFGNSFNVFLESKGLSRENQDIYIFDNICQCFTDFKTHGILKIYQGREAAAWYPKVIIDKFIGFKEDIDELDEEIVIYRGTSQNEYDSGDFGQSWSISKEKAEEFAFINYSHQKHYQNTLRVVLSTTINKNAVFFYKKNGKENEVIVDTKQLSKNLVKIIMKKII